MSIASKLSSSQGQRDQGPNHTLAREIITHKDAKAVDELFALFDTEKRAVLQDAILVIAEVAEATPTLVAPHVTQLLTHLESKHNRVIWGALSAILGIVDIEHKSIMANLDKVLAGADMSSVVAKDRVMRILSKLNARNDYNHIVTPVILQRLQHCAVNQAPMYAEGAASTISAENWAEFAEIVSHRRDQISYPAKKKRLQKVLDAGARRAD